MSCLVTDADVAMRELQRQEWIVHAQRARATTRSEDGAAVLAYLQRDARIGRLAGPADPRLAASSRGVEAADPLGVWSYRSPRSPRRWPAGCAVADWAVWAGLCLLAIADVATR